MGYKPAMGVEKAALTTAWSALKQGAIGMPTKGIKVYLLSPLSITTTTTSIRIAISTQNAIT